MNIIQWKQDETSHKTCHFCSTFCHLSANSQDPATFDRVIPRCADSLDSDTARRYRSTTPLATADNLFTNCFRYASVVPARSSRLCTSIAP